MGKRKEGKEQKGIHFLARLRWGEHGSTKDGEIAA